MPMGIFFFVVQQKFLFFFWTDVIIDDRITKLDDIYRNTGEWKYNFTPERFKKKENARKFIFLYHEHFLNKPITLPVKEYYDALTGEFRSKL